MNRERLLERFLRYVRIDTTAVEDAGVYPSSPGQLVLGRLLVDELQAMGIQDASQDEHGIVLATLPANGEAGDAPTVAFNAHLDTSPETTGKNVQPQVIRNYPGGDIVLPGNAEQVIRISENPELADLVGATIVTTDGTTLLGGDDKAGLAVIMELTQHLLEHPEISHGRVRLLFTCDEEIGHGVDHVDLEKLAAQVCYTLDGSGAGVIDIETFSADLAVVTLRGVNIHPAIAHGRMVNALRAAGEFLAALPREQAPETTSGRQGFLHPYAVEGGVEQASIRIILRDFNTAALAEQAKLLTTLAAQVEKSFPGLRVDVEVTKQYRNLAEGLRREPRAVGLAEQAHQRLGTVAQFTSIRGGTDGSQLTERGLPTPNLAVGQHCFHSPREWVCLEEMRQAGQMLVELVQLWAAAKR